MKKKNAEWLAATRDGVTLPMKVTVELNPDGLDAGEYTAKINLTVPGAFNPVVEIPVRLRVFDPPPVE